MSFDFVPRSVKKRKTNLSAAIEKSLAHNEELSSNALIQNATPSAMSQTTVPAPKISVLNSPKDPDIRLLADLVCLALSNYALWVEIDLRRKIEWNAQPSNDAEIEEAKPSVNDSAGFIPLAYLFRRSPVFIHALSLPSSFQYPEMMYVKALRNYATEFVDVRLVLSSETNHSRNPTGYEVRRKFPADTDSSEYSKPYWHRLTIYVENIPAHYRHLPGTLKFITELLPPPVSHDPTRVQNIVYPRHHRDQPNDIPVCKGFALITLKAQKDIDYILENWPWNVHSSSKLEHGQILTQEAAKFGFRSITKQGWESFKAEYLLFRQQLVQEINQLQEKRQISESYSEAAAQFTNQGIDLRSEIVFDPSSSNHVEERAEMAHVTTSSAAKIHTNSPYPMGCLVFVRHLHTETNKTTLRTLFMQAWNTDGEEAPPSASQSIATIDYLDYMKGMDSCHIRFSIPSYAEQFVKYFANCNKRQTSGLDGVGLSLESADTTIMTAERVLGKREEVYWEKVPEKVKRQAVEKALKLLNLQENNDNRESEETGSGCRKRKR